MYNFNAGEVPQPVIDGVMQLASTSKQSLSHITENILKYLTGVGGVSKEVMAEAVTEFASMTGIEIGQAQGLVKVLLNILKASYRGGLTSAQVAEDFQRLTGSVEAAEPIVSLWSKYVHQSDTAPEAASTASEGAGHPEAPTDSAVNAQPAPAGAEPVTAVRARPSSAGVPADSDHPSAEAPLAALEDVLQDAGVRAFDELQDIRWSFGVTAASSEPDRVGATFVRLALHVRSVEGRPAVRHVQLTVSQFYSLLHQLEKAHAAARFM